MKEVELVKFIRPCQQLTCLHFLHQDHIRIARSSAEVAPDATALQLTGFASCRIIMTIDEVSWTKRRTCDAIGDWHVADGQE